MTNYERGYATGCKDWLNAAVYDPGSASPEWSIGYEDGWTATRDEAIATYGYVEAIARSWNE